MDLSFPLLTIAPTLDAGVLQVLAATTSGCSAAEVHRRLGRGSDEGVRKVLARLAEQGIVLVETPVRYPVYRLNREHLAAPHIEALTRLRAELVDRIRDDVSSWEITPVHAGLFGSFARGTADAESDVDLLVVRAHRMTSSDEDTWLGQVDRLDRRIHAWTGNRAQVIDVDATTVARMADEADPLVDSWLADEILLVGQRIVDLLRGAR
ncbi:nucleotidyltransferase domain-containing protein [Phycicoccus sp. CSK15P-2]|uniref:nucleotidyltransferase domain-containing protein n=1 Tax=Phycicoccus sp. CSK15P-2 TaxID=2807627 RepID=UPI00194F2BB7|nr:nucleotidyltransferase domain-containing protein [Phycicoccus sp. CSK15P-2]MBM6404827.1 nucleotidyltransferase domain-containing protein [Phycicoccus sp. CSK15P-2]